MSNINSKKKNIIGFTLSQRKMDNNFKIKSVVKWFLLPCDLILGSCTNLFKVCLLTWQLQGLNLSWTDKWWNAKAPSSAAEASNLDPATCAHWSSSSFCLPLGVYMTSPLDSYSDSQREPWCWSTCLRLVKVIPRVCSAGLDRLICFQGSRHYIGPWETLG